ncbi:PREDICTED: aldehyde dehydrogenase, cytosolic 1-like [Ceratosolen solmsi marchali]|uniref:Aldehyde dehydrogenase, cytosolic 1-like n=1 Tax=Ceratosolen solmsi marchali TaxID=326594 RepID=A0AAJ7DW42_9HYME|nr:PREDICTED: aldehyde dehydrogenase, cytosolic 1-like [Ceratosolen solmsi marchali]
MAPPPEPRSNQRIKFDQLFINNEFVNSVSGETYTSVNPSTEKLLAVLQQANEVDVDKAVKVARDAFEVGSPWRSLTDSARGLLLNKLADLIEENVNEIANLESLDNGKPFIQSYGQTLEAIKFVRYFAGCTDKIHGKTISSDGGVLVYTTKEPVGVVGIIIPWNYPIVLLSFKLSMALAAGCTVVVKPAEQTTLNALFLGHLIKEAGFPPGVVNILSCSGPAVGIALTHHKDVDKISFTGSTMVGKLVLEAAAKSNLKKVTLELGGKSPAVVFNDADLDLALKYISQSVFVTAGQTCFAPTRLYVQSGIYDKFVQKFIEIASKIKVGGPFEADVFQGPQIDSVFLERVLSYIEIGKKEGAKCVLGGKRHGSVGYFIEPTVFTEVTDDMTITKDEIFGPVEIIFKFDTLDEVIRRANNNKYGLAAGVFTENLNTAVQFSKAIQAGTVWVNQWANLSPQTPFSGHKMSGMGTELGIDSLDGLMNTKVTNIRLSSDE